MLENRKILTATIGYIIGIIMGLYCKISIVLFYVFIFLIYNCFSKKNKKNKFKLISFRRYFRYIKIVFNKKAIKIIIIFSVISNSVVLVQNYKYENLYKSFEDKEINAFGTIISKKDDKYKIKIKKINNSSKYENTYLYLYTNTNLELGDSIFLKGEFSVPTKRSNYKGFDYSSYLKTLKIYGTVSSNNIELVSKNNLNLISKFTNKLVDIFKVRINTNFEENKKALLEGILLGDKENIEEQITNNFSKSNISYILAISGMHVSYLIIISNFIFEKLCGKHYSKIFTSIVLIIYMSITNFTPSVVRAGITGIIVLIANFVYRKNDTFQTLSISLLILLIYNPYLIQNVGLELSFAGTIGILVFYRNFKKIILVFSKRVEKRAIRKNKKILKIIVNLRNLKAFQALEDSTLVTISATLVVFPIVLINFHKINITNLLISILVSFVIGPIVIFGILFILLNSKILAILVSKFLDILIFLSERGSNLILNQIYFITPSKITIIFYYFLIFTINFILKVNLTVEKTQSQKRVKNLIELAKFKLRKNKDKFISLILMLCIISTIVIIIPKKLKIYFIDVGQGDATLIITPKNKSILIDGGGSLTDDFDVRRKNIDTIFAR